jgi:hypothetical protein
MTMMIAASLSAGCGTGVVAHDALPNAPTEVTATAGNASAQVSWQAPDLGGASLSFYLVTSNPSGITTTAVDTSTTITGLTNGTPYTFTVTATTVLGTGPASAPSNPVTPSANATQTVPDAPSAVTAMAGVGQATVSWTAPHSTGGSPLTGYVVVPSVSGVLGAAMMVTDPAATSTTVTGLTNGVTYTFTVAATNALGTSAASAPSNPVMPVAAQSVPDAPTAVQASGGVARATVTWSLPVNNGGSPLTAFVITPYLGATALSPVRIEGGALTQGVVMGLTNGMAYTFTVAAINTIGTSAASAHSNAVTPAANATVPGAPTGVTAVSAGPSKIQVSWTPPTDNGGSALTGYSVSPSTGGSALPSVMVVGGSLTSALIWGLTDGTSYTFTVSAINGVGPSSASMASNAASPGALSCSVQGFPSVPELMENNVPSNSASSPQVLVDFVSSEDLNGDGKPDLVHVNHDSNSVSVYLAKGSGAFKDAVDYPTGAGPRGLVLGDVDGNGKVDLVVTNSGDNSISVLRGNGDGTFAAMIKTTTGTDPRGVALGDFNNDGKLDAVVANWAANSVSLLVGMGNGNFQPKVDYTAHTNPSSVVVRDFNGDGKPDVAVANYSDSNITVFLNSGGAFAAGVTYLSGVYPVGIIAADFNGDSKVDLVTANHNGNSISLLLGGGNGTFQTPTSFAAGNSPDGLVAADLNADGKLDVALANYKDGTVSVLMGSGTGMFAAKVDYLVGSGPQSVAAADFNGDGKADLAVANYFSSDISVLVNSGGGAFPQRKGYDWGGRIPSTVGFGDFNHDGKIDVVASCSGVCVYPGNGDGTLKDSIDEGLLSSGQLAIADFNMDGWLDVAVDNPDNFSSTTKGLGIFLNAAGTIPAPDGGVAPIFKPIAYYSGITASNALATGDLNGDSRPDLVLTNSSLVLTALLGNGDGTFQPQKLFPPGGANGPIGLGDFNKDGKLDVVMASFDTPDMAEFLGNGDGTFQAPRSFTMGTSLHYAHGAAVADLNADGAPDVVVSYDNDIVAVRLGNGDGTFKAEVDYPAGLEPGAVTIADVNGDGKLDLVVPNSGFMTCGNDSNIITCASNTVSVLFGNGDGTFQPKVNYQTGNGPQTAGVGDLNGDGKADLVVVDWVDQSLDVMLSACF